MRRESSIAFEFDYATNCLSKLGGSGHSDHGWTKVCLFTTQNSVCVCFLVCTLAFCVACTLQSHVFNSICGEK